MSHARVLPVDVLRAYTIELAHAPGEIGVSGVRVRSCNHSSLLDVRRDHALMRTRHVQERLERGWRPAPLLARHFPQIRVLTWAQRLKRVFGIDISQCPHCGGRLRVIARGRLRTSRNRKSSPIPLKSSQARTPTECRDRHAFIPDRLTIFADADNSIIASTESR
mgnify:CR=1 FL=1